MELNAEDKVAPVKLFFVTYTPDNCDDKLPPIIFIPGFFSTNRTFSSVKYKICRQTKRKCYVIELRNHGKSEYSEHFTLKHELADLEQFMETQNIERAVLAGHSMGGRLALAMALKHPNKVEKVIVEDISVVSTKTTLEEYMRLMMFFKFLNQRVRELPNDISENEAQQLLMPYVEKFFPLAVDNFSKAKNKVRVPLYRDSSGKITWEFNMDVVISVENHFDLFDVDLSSNPVFTGDTLLLAGEKSITDVQHDLDQFYKHFPKLECRVIQNGFHTYHVEFPEVYVKLVSQFINEKKI